MNTGKRSILATSFLLRLSRLPRLPTPPAFALTQRFGKLGTGQDKQRLGKWMSTCAS
jgi:hypothetical protein